MIASQPSQPLKFDGCFHGGAFFQAIGERFETLDLRQQIINADVLDAWFPPAPRVIAALNEHLPWLLQTSPPINCGGLIDVITEVRGVDRSHVLPGAGSSDLIFLALREWLDRDSRALVLDPTYSEYTHVLENVIGCQVDRLRLSRDDHYRVPLDRLAESLQSGGYDLILLVNPNSPTGQFIFREALQSVLVSVPARTRVWIDETYIDYVDSEQSLERYASRTDNVVVCKSMSKVYALSGARVAYLCGSVAQIEPLRRLTPPWAVSLLAQVAAVEALRDPDYYAARHRETHALREQLAVGLSSLGWEVVSGCVNFLLAHLPDHQPTTPEVIANCRERGLFLRDVSSMGTVFDNRTIRVAVKAKETQRRMLEILNEVLGG
ncbi:MAG: histidinol-phosphate aminotransferase family protein [Planctomycetes bacterium]|nr:histidinol-phosphate aminotransferase family protein [Planctomycetota bacterium]